MGHGLGLWSADGIGPVGIHPHCGAIDHDGFVVALKASRIASHKPFLVPARNRS